MDQAFGSSATLLLLAQHLVCCIHRLNPQPKGAMAAARKQSLNYFIGTDRQRLRACEAELAEAGSVHPCRALS
jgi:hypothetical protein